MDGSDPTVEDLRKKIETLEAELRITGQLLSDRQKVIDLIPPCELHGSNCLPHAADWIMSAKRKLGIQETQ